MSRLDQVVADPRVRVHQPGAIDPRGRCVVYRMRRAQRALDNPALETAIAAANEIQRPVVVFFGLAKRPAANLRQYTFMLEGLAKTARQLARRRIGFVLRVCADGRTEDEFARLCARLLPALVVADEDPARREGQWAREARLWPSAPLWSVDADVIVPSRLLEKEQFAARTIRPRIQRRLGEFLRPVENRPVRVAWSGDRTSQSLAVSADLIDRLHPDRSVGVAGGFTGGTDAALMALRRFIREGLPNYATGRNHPERDATSRLSPYLHFGQIGPHTVAIAIRDAPAPAPDRQAFLEELIVRRELAVNFVRYNPRFRTEASIEPWARRTLDDHAGDPRAHRYSERQLENAETHDPLWNAAQRQMVSSGWMHGYLRMYWAKKILEWSPAADQAYEICVRLNDRYELDGRDPNGYAGIAWAIGGKHDRAWGPERPVYGKIRYMSLASTARKFDSRAYIERWSG